MKVPKARKLPSGTWFLQMRLGGVSVPVTGNTKADVIHQAEQIKAEYRAKGQKNKAGHNPTLEFVINNYIDSRSRVLSPSTIKAYRSVAAHRFSSFRNYHIDEIKDWQKVINAEIADGVSPKTIKNTWSLLAASLDYAGIPVPKVKLPQIMPALRPWLDDEQIITFVAAIKGHPCEIPALLALHSLRRSEILALTWRHIDLKHETITVSGSAVIDVDNNLVQKKTNKSAHSKRKIPIMIPELTQALKAVPESGRDGLVVACYPNTIYSQVNKICRQNGLPEVGVHGLRHSFASLAHHLGVPEEEAMLIGGWEDAQTMHKIYTHVSQKDQLTAQSKLKNFFQNANENANGLQKTL